MKRKVIGEVDLIVGECHVVKYWSDEKPYVDIWWWGYPVDVVGLQSFVGIFVLFCDSLDIKTCKYCNVWGVACIGLIKMRGGKARNPLQLVEDEFW
jgi:hypothetical protein